MLSATIQKWHKRLGLFAALFILLLAASGIALNHSEQLQLNRSYIQASWLLDLYQIDPGDDPVGFHNRGMWVSQVGERLYFNELEIATDVGRLIGVISTQDTHIIAFDGKLQLVANNGATIERIEGAEGVPAGMKRIGRDAHGDIVIQAAHGYYHVNLDILKWKEHAYLDADWSVAASIPHDLRQRLLKQYRGRGLTLERVLLDLHSGRIFGAWGVYFFDLIAIILLALSGTGVWMWWQRK